MEDITALTTLQEQSGKRKMNERQPLLFQQQSIDSESDRKYENSNVRNSPNNSVLDVQNEDSLGEPLENISKFEYNLSTHRVLDHPTSNMDTMIHLLKGNIGTGILAMPDAFKNAGLYVGLFGTLFMGAICTHCMHILVNCSHELCCRLKLPALSFSEVAYGSFETGPTTLRRYSSVARKTVTSFLFITQIGFCCVYFLFVALNVQEVVAHYYIKVDVRIYLISMLVPMIFINLVRNLKYLTPISLFAAVLTVTGLAITFFYMLHDLPHTSTVTPVATWSSLPLYFGTAIYAFEGIGVILPLENNMKTPEDFRGLTGVLNTGMVIVACLYTSVGFFGYLKYGDNVQGSITLNLPPDEILSQMVRIAMAVAIFFSYTLQFYVPVNLIEPHVRAYFDTEQAKQLSTTLVRVVLVTITFILAACIPNLGPIISLVGAVSSSTLALIAPPIIEIATFWYIGYGRYNWVFWKDVAILTFGICGFLFGTYASILQIINSN